MLDPNHKICGRGERMLREAGIQVSRFDPETMDLIEELNREFTREQKRLTPDPATGSGGAKKQAITPFEWGSLLLVVCITVFIAVEIFTGAWGVATPTPKREAVGEPAREGLDVPLAEFAARHAELRKSGSATERTAFAASCDGRAVRWQGDLVRVWTRNDLQFGGVMSGQLWVQVQFRTGQLGASLSPKDFGQVLIEGVCRWADFEDPVEVVDAIIVNR